MIVSLELQFNIVLDCSGEDLKSNGSTALMLAAEHDFHENLETTYLFEVVSIDLVDVNQLVHLFQQCQKLVLWHCFVSYYEASDSFHLIYIVESVFLQGFLEEGLIPIRHLGELALVGAIVVLHTPFEES